MGCKEIRDNMSAYLDHELGEAEYVVIKQHLAQCPACRSQHDKLILTKRSLKKLPECPAPEGFLFRLQEKIEKQEASWWKKAGWSLENALDAVPLRIMTGVAGVVLLVAVILAGVDAYRVPDQSLSHRSSVADTYTGPEVLSSATEPLPVEFAGTNPAEFTKSAYLDTPNELLLTVVRNDPRYQDSKILPHPRGQGVLVNTGQKLLEITMEPAEFPIIQDYLAHQGGQVPQTLDQARAKFPIYVREHPSPNAPLENPEPNLHQGSHTNP
ncbi:MAG: anti-sigma factor [bacterium]